MIHLALKIKTTNVDYFNELRDGESASPGVNSKIYAIGLMLIDDSDAIESKKIFFNENEKELLLDFWNYICNINEPISLVTWHGSLFDFPILYQRTYINKIAVKNFNFPMIETLGTFKANSAINQLVDLGHIWKCGNFKQYDKLYNVAIAFNLFESEQEKNFFKVEEERFKTAYADWSESIKNCTQNISKMFLELQLTLIKKLAKIIIV
jgi:DNA polymerase elongation subunit (family B)